MNGRVAWSLATIIGVGVGSGVFVWLVSSVVFTGTIALSWTLGIGLALQHEDLMFGSPQTRGRSASLWSGAFTGFLMLAALFGTMSLPVADRLGLAIALLVFGVGFAALQFGVGMVLAHREARANTEENPRTAP
jgi:hypothetical protein